MEWLARLLNQAGLYAEVRGNMEGATTLMQSSVDLTREVHGEESEQYTSALSNLSGQHTDAGRYEAAEEGFRRVLEIEEAMQGPNHPRIAVHLNNLGEVYWKQEQFARVEPLLDRALRIGRDNHGEYSPQVALRLNSLGTLYDNWAEQPGQGHRRAWAQELKEQALATARTVRGERHPQVSQYLHNLAVLFERLEDFERAAALERRATAIMLSLGLQEHPHTQQRLQYFHLFLDRAGQGVAHEEVVPLVVPEIFAVEAEMFQWVEEDAENRQFGPQSFFADKPELLQQLKKAMETADE